MRTILGILLVLFLPGYLLIAARFPGKGGIERIALSFGPSIDVVPLSGMALNYVPFGIRLVQTIVVRSIVHSLACSGRVCAVGGGFRGGTVRG